MARQVRSEATRRKILSAAIEVFGEVGYAAATWGTIVQRTGMTKGALYHHFDSKESLASGILEEGSDTLFNALRNVCGSASPGLENLLHGTFTILEVLTSNKTVCAAEQLASVLVGFNEGASRFYENLIVEMAEQARRAISEGDLRGDVDPVMLGESIVGTILGTRLVSKVLSARDMNGDLSDDFAGRLRQKWGLLLPGIVTEVSLPYIQQFLSREAMRYAPAAVPRDVAESAAEIG
ncbi:TetR/AcrR family transcriptional regulator [Mycobacterium marseillense]|uniref:TetR/AcrR family transcriptional regulator n=1 Tax=Mycobacterium marseillense TaxID=701042 RepID=UPI00119DC485|nr:TetR/AcrR family transcriptional regulator [Mycobacterium marseillense]